MTRTLVNDYAASLPRTIKRWMRSMIGNPRMGISTSKALRIILQSQLKGTKEICPSIRIRSQLGLI